MPYPPKPPRKHRTPEGARSVEQRTRAASVSAGTVGEPGGFSAGRREQLELVERLVREAAPEAIATLRNLTRNSEDERVRALAAAKLLEFLPRRKEYDPKDDEKPPLSSLPPEQRRQRVSELLAWAASIKVPPDFKAAEIIEAQAEPSSTASGLSVTCAMCGTVFPAQGMARYCSDACRAAAEPGRARWRNGG
jgi:hypothetical protein